VSGYSFDTSSFLNGRRDLFPPTTFPTVWERIEVAVGDGTITAIDEVFHELSRRDDDVAAWAKEHRELFVELGEQVQLATAKVLTAHPKLIGVGSGRSSADPFVVAHAIATDATVVTEETKSGSSTKPRIPDVCEAMGVRCTNLVGFISEQGWRF
jgi:hypothetical protein